MTAGWDNLLRGILALVALGYLGAMLVDQWGRVRDAIAEVARLAKRRQR